MGRSVLAATLVVMALLTLQLPAGECGVCFSNPDCTGAQITAGSASARECCVGTDDGLSYGTPGNCRQCIVHGFSLVEYSTDEDSWISLGTFGLNRKGSSSILPSIPGTITSMGITATESQDYERLVVNVGPVDREITWELDLISDNLALEFVEELSLNFEVNPGFQVLVGLALTAGEFIRDSVNVTIADNDVLDIYFDRSQIEGAAVLQNDVSLSFKQAQIPFTIEVIHASITDALDENFHNLAEFLNIDFTDIVHATPGSDFVASTYNLGIRSRTNRITLRRISILEDNINEAEEVFILVVKLVGVAESTACFRQQSGGECMGDTGGIIIRIRDNDPMLIGFGTRSTTIYENRFPDQDSFSELLNVVSLRRSELTYTMIFSVRGHRTAEVVSEGQEFSPDFPNWDASFGRRSLRYPSDPPFYEDDLSPGLLMLARNISLVIHNDVNVEETKFFTLRINPRDVGSGVFECYDDTEVPTLGNFFCSHTFYIVDTDVSLSVSFEKTVYEVIESIGRVEVCVILTEPGYDILENTVNVEVFVDDDSIYIPNNVNIATGRLPPPFRPEPSPPFNEDYPQQLLGFNDLRDIQIRENAYNEIRRRICYNQTIYNDVRLEADEWTGLTLQIGASTARTVTGIDHTAIRIIDDDDIVIGGITVTGNTVEVSANYRAAGWILMILIDSNGTEHRRYFYGTSGSVVFGNLPTGHQRVRAQSWSTGWQSGWSWFYVP